MATTSHESPRRVSDLNSYGSRDRPSERRRRAFFLEHLADWFLRPQQGVPSLQVWVGQGLHLVMLFGLVLMLRWDRLGAVVTMVATAAFFASIGMHGFPWIALVNLLPIACFAVSWATVVPGGDRDKAADGTADLSPP
jgi:hypothetical protein